MDRRSFTAVLCQVCTFTIDGLQPRRIDVEVDIRPGLPSFTVVGLGDAAVREARERVRAALLNAGFEFPLRRITVNLAPAHLRKTGPGFDLAIAVGVLGAAGGLPGPALERWAIFGELSLGGELRRCRGALAVAEGARRSGMPGLVLPAEQAREAALVDGVTVAGVPTLGAAVALLRGGPVPDPPVPAPADAAGSVLDLGDVRGQAPAVHALEVAAAGGHNLLLEGSPGTGKTMLARRLPSILPPLDRDEALEVTRVHSVAGLHAGEGLVDARPFRAPHHAISVSGLVGGGAQPAPGEATLAHHGVLFLDELSEFSRPSLEALRQPLKDGEVTVVRGQRSTTFPTRFMLVAATNPCPCGHAGDSGRECVCGPAEQARHRRRLSGPLLDRLDLLVHVGRPRAAELAAPPVASSRDVRERVGEARERQAWRLRGSPARCNAHMDAALVRRHVRLDLAGSEALERAYHRGKLSARAHHRVLRVARTLADLEGVPGVNAGHVLQAVTARQLEALDL